MKKGKRFLSAVAAVALSLAFSAGAFAASYNAASWSDLQTAFSDTSGEDININLTGNIDCTGELNTATDVTYTITTANGSSLKNPTFKGSGEVSIAADVNGTLETKDGSSVSVTVSGDISADKTAVKALGSGSVAVTGDVTGGEYGVYATKNSSVTVTGDVYGGVKAADSSGVTVNGNVYGANGDEAKVDYNDPYGGKNGGVGVHAGDSSTVTVNGNVEGGSGYGAIASGGTGVYAEGSSTVMVSGNVSGGDVKADPSTSPTGSSRSHGGIGVQTENTATVEVGGSVKGGNTNAAKGKGGDGIQIDYLYEQKNVSVSAGSVTVGGAVAGGTAPNGSSGEDIRINNWISSNSYDDYLHPDVTVGSYATSSSTGFEKDELQSFLSGVVQTNPVKKEDEQDGFWQEVYWEIYRAEKGDRITADAGDRTTMPAYIMDAVRAHEVVLVIKWNGGEEIVVEKAYDGDEKHEFFLLAELAERYKK